eukprot:7089099-Alexandrium_andersonii.AAC.1
MSLSLRSPRRNLGGRTPRLIHWKTPWALAESTPMQTGLGPDSPTKRPVSYTHLRAHETSAHL